MQTNSFKLFTEMSCCTLILFFPCPNRSFLPAFVPLIGYIARYSNFIYTHLGTFLILNAKYALKQNNKYCSAKDIVLYADTYYFAMRNNKYHNTLIISVLY